MRRAIRNANVRWFSDKQKRKSRRRTSPQQIVGLRLNEFARLFRSRYGVALPDDDAGRDDIEPVIHHLAALTHAGTRAAHWLELWAPWLTLAEQRQIIGQGIATARPWTADQLAWRYRITKEERNMLALTTIGAIDQGKAARTKRRKQRDRERKAAARRSAGVKSRREYEGQSLSRAKPWIVEGIDRATWYRRRAKAMRQVPSSATSPATA